MSVNLYRFARNVVKIILTPIFRIQTVGRESFPKDGGVLICANHIDNLDPPVVGITSPRDIHFMAKEELFHAPILKQLLPNINAFPVKRGLSDKGALKMGLKILKDGEVLGLFPEGTRSKTGELGKGLAGAGFFALRTNAVVVPCAIIGPYKPFRKLKVVYGKPVDFSQYREQKLSAEEATEIIMDEIRKLISAHK
ncbi:acyl-phosphate glycerol 3-phosphate acyltransferase [Peribacillus asahii]|uniref:Acyl-phosphate glycerol 3-phosphate acyltransferase n=1 Tax=Peribacillus asahii TaxID=228899 RepID=A0A3Q9RQ24_9BACI|nr:lysophospholipid acyltransferase family protein [Peribacillus asahii]AZV44157.1 acyl-phosphate glycerol 3-phosphate acyltransferase [Peribacillus asahii]USK83875.1 1-acyl-sn-glycerol-3-phosphate acyltransferase [Peribacillus asahii]